MYPFKVYNSVVFSKFTEACHHHPLGAEHFRAMRETAYPLESLPNPLATTNPISVSADLPILDFSYKWNHAVYSLLRLAFFSWHNGFRIYPYRHVSVLPSSVLPVRGHWAHHSPRPGRAGPARELHRREPHAASPGRGHQDGAPVPWMLSQRPRRPPWAELPLWAQGQVLPRPGGAGHRAGAPGKPPPHTSASRPGEPPPTPRLGRDPGPRQAHVRLTSLRGV
ncbi:uroporphyrinogen-III synthase isoform X4 [Monodon monoceros]|uniref:uroporphyrinogen-III synthase isoform X4 n=1 Tax=Monodon monoceros TaxID=40151 RepID=UPI0010F9A0F2|nr:uroporphyrinogen-III synthase isoform X4 [Monodon monoceros]